MPKFLLPLFALVFAFSLPLAAPAFAKDGKGNFSSHKKYKVSGQAAIRGRTLTLSGFRTTKGPDLYIYVGNGGPSRRVAKLKANSGTQSYRLPAGNWSSVHVHCKRFNSTFGSARIN